jgi:hypothetical protein
MHFGWAWAVSELDLPPNDTSESYCGFFDSVRVCCGDPMTVTIDYSAFESTRFVLCQATQGYDNSRTHQFVALAWIGKRALGIETYSQCPLIPSHIVSALESYLLLSSDP